MREIAYLTDRELVMARLARKLARGKDAIFHGTRYANETLRSGKLIPPDFGCCAICLTRSPETAAYFALMVGKEVDQWSGAVLVLTEDHCVSAIVSNPIGTTMTTTAKTRGKKEFMAVLSPFGGI